MRILLVMLGGITLAAGSRVAIGDDAKAPPRNEASGSWRGLDVPRYPNGTDFRISTDEDEYKIYFQSQDDVRAVFDYYRDDLEKQGFQVTRTKPQEHGFKADMVREQGGSRHSVELDAKRDHGRYKVEIELAE